MGHLNFIATSQSPPPLRNPACSASRICACRCPVEGPSVVALGTRRYPAARLRAGDSCTVHSDSAPSSNAPATVLEQWKLHSVVRRQKLLLNMCNEGQLAGSTQPLTFSVSRPPSTLALGHRLEAHCAWCSRAQKLPLSLPRYCTAILQRLKCWNRVHVVVYIYPMLCTSKYIIQQYCTLHHMVSLPGTSSTLSVLRPPRTRY